MSSEAATHTTTHNMVLTRHFDAPPARVWKAWSEADQVTQWWGPMGFTSPMCKMNFRVGGVTRVCMRIDGFDMFNSWTYTKLVPMQEIEFIQHFTDSEGNQLDPSQLGLPPGIPFEVRHVITFKAEGANGTEMTVTEYGYTEAAVVEISKEGMNQVLDKMAALVAQG